MIAYQLLCGELPFEGVGGSFHAAVKVILESPPRLIGGVDRALRGDVEAIVHRAMERHPEQRYQSAADFAADIRRYLRHEPIAARRHRSLYVIRKFVERHRTLVAAGTLALLLIIGALVTTSLFWANARRAEREAVWQRYRLSMSAAGFAISKNEVGAARRHMEGIDPRLRGWEYWHLLSRTDQSRSRWTPNVPAPFMVVPEQRGCVMVDPQSRTLMSATNESASPMGVDQRLLLWYSAQGSRSVECVNAEGAGIYVAGSSGEPVFHRVEGWPFASGEVLYYPRLSADDRVFAVVRREETASAIVAVDLVTNRARVVPLGLGVVASELALSAEGTRAAVSTGFARPQPFLAQVIDLASGAVVATVPATRQVAIRVLLDREGRRLFVGFNSGSMEAFDVTGDPPSLVARQSNSFDSIQNLTLSGNERLLGGSTIDGLVRVFDAETLENTLMFFGHETEVHDVRFLPGDMELISAGRDGVVRTWELRQPREQPLVLRGHTHLVHALAIGVRGRFVVTGSWDRSVRFFNLDTGEQVARLSTDDFVQAMALSPDERVVATREFKGDVRLFDVEARLPIVVLDRPMARLDQPVFHKGSRQVLFDFDRDRCEATIWDLDRSEWITVPGEALTSFDGTIVSSAAGAIAVTEIRERRQFVVLYEFRTGRELLAVPTRRVANEAVAFSSDGGSVAIPDEQDRIQEYELRTGRAVSAFKGHTREVLALTYSPDGARLFSADLSGAVFVWDAATHEELTQLRGHSEHVRRLVVSPDGSLLVSGSRDGTARVWESRGAVAGDGRQK